MELKYVGALAVPLGVESSNRTFMELKWDIDSKFVVFDFQF